MKNAIHILVICLFSSFAVAQTGSGKGDYGKIQQLKIGFITDKLDLTVEESQKFWPIYNQLEKEINALKKSVRDGEKKSIKEYSDAELESRILKRFEMQKKEIEIKEKYFEQLKTALPMKKLARLTNIEKRFRQMLLEKLRSQKGKR